MQDLLDREDLVSAVQYLQQPRMRYLTIQEIINSGAEDDVYTQAIILKVKKPKVGARRLVGSQNKKITLVLETYHRLILCR